MKDIKSLIIGFLLAISMFLFSGWTGYNQGAIACNSITLIDNEGNIYANIDKNLIDKINGYDITLEDVSDIQNNLIDKINGYDITLEDISDIKNNLKIINNQLETIEDVCATNTQNALQITSKQQKEIDGLKNEFSEILVKQVEELEDYITSLKVEIKRDARAIDTELSQVYDHIGVHRNRYNDSDSNTKPKFEYIAREVEPSAYPGFTVADFVEYPELAKEAGIEGRVIIAAFINTQGITEHIYLVKGVFESLDKEALNAVKQSRWIPAKQRGKKIGIWVNIPVSFKLR